MTPSQTQAQAPVRSHDQRMEALKRANDIRVKRAQLKKDLKSGDVSIEEILRDPPEFVSTAKVFDIDAIRKSTVYNVLDQSTNQNASAWNSPADHFSLVRTFGGAVSYVTGTHSFKTGILTEQMKIGTVNFVNDHKVGFAGESYGNISYRFLNGLPNGITQYATPTDRLDKMKTFGAFAQDQWVLNRLTLNLGLRFDYFNGYVPPQSAPAGVYVPARQFNEVRNVPNWTDISPRVGGVYDLFGNGRTALKAYMGRYVTQEASTITSANNPFTTTVSSVNRTWNDRTYAAGDPRRDNFVPDCDLTNPLANGECGAYANQNFGRINPSATRYDRSVLQGFGVRPASWDYTVELSQQVGSGVSITGGYTRISGYQAYDGRAAPSSASALRRRLNGTISTHSPFFPARPVRPERCSSVS